MAEKKTASQRRAAAVTSFFSGKVIPGGPSSTAFESVIKALRSVVTKDDKAKKKNAGKTQAEKLFGDE